MLRARTAVALLLCLATVGHAVLVRSHHLHRAASPEMLWSAAVGQAGACTAVRRGGIEGSSQEELSVTVSVDTAVLPVMCDPWQAAGALAERGTAAAGAAQHADAALWYAQAARVGGGQWPQWAHVLADAGAHLQLVGDLEGAEAAYNAVLQESPAQGQALGNLLGLRNAQGRHAAAAPLAAALALIQPRLASQDVNLGDFAAAEGNWRAARTLFTAAFDSSGDVGFLLRRATLGVAVNRDVSEMAAIRAAARGAVREVTALQSAHRVAVDFVRSVEYQPFLLAYQGTNEVAFWRAFRRACLAPRGHVHIRRGVAPVPGPVRVAFMSAYFGVNQPHGQLLQGVLAALDRRAVHVTVLSTKPVSPAMAGAADRVLRLDAHAGRVAGTVAALGLDVLVFADQYSEPVASALAAHRVAPVQAAFWGNPVTSGHEHSMDFFISGDSMEALPAAHAHYTEQLVRLGGLGIHLRAPPAAHPPLPAVAGDWRAPRNASVTFACLQSVYKLHPLFLEAVRRVLVAVPGSVVLFLRARLDVHTAQLQGQLESQWGVAVASRAVFAPRLAGEAAFMRVLAQADVALHPFPFDGAKTAVDTAAAGVPMVTMPTEHLRGRMGCAVSLGLGLQRLVASTPQHYVSLAVQLGTDERFRAAAAAQVVRAAPSLWADADVAREWEEWLLQVAGRPLPPRDSAGPGVRQPLCPAFPFEQWQDAVRQGQAQWS